MKNPHLPILAVLLTTSVASSAATLLFADNFDAPDTNNLDASSQEGRTSGMLGDALQVRSARIQHGIVGGQLDLLRPDVGSGRIRFHDLDGEGNPITGGAGVGWHDFASGDAGAAVVSGGGLRVAFDWVPTNNTSDNWISWNVGIDSTEPTTRVNHGETDLGILFRNNGDSQYFLNGAATTLEGAFDATLESREVVLEFAFTSFADGSEVTMSAWVDTQPVVESQVFQWSGNNGALFMELGGYENGTRIDNFSIEAIPEPSTALLLFAAGGLAFRRRVRA